MTKRRPICVLENRHANVRLLHPAEMFVLPSYRPVEPALRRHLADLRPSITDEQINREIALYFRRHPEDAP
jgi:hypothetical protein